MTQGSRLAGVVMAIAITAATAVFLSGGVLAQPALSKGDAVSMERKLAAIVDRAGKPPAAVKKAGPLRTSFTEREVNAYLKFNSDVVPVGVVAPQIRIADSGRLEARAIVDLDAVRKSKPRGMFDLANFLSGSLEIRASGRLEAAGGTGMGKFELESASVGSLPLPKPLLQELVSYYSRTDTNPSGFDFDKPFELPVGIRAVETRAGAATVIQ